MSIILFFPPCKKLIFQPNAFINFKNGTCAMNNRETNRRVNIKGIYYLIDKRAFLGA